MHMLRIQNFYFCILLIFMILVVCLKMSDCDHESLANALDTALLRIKISTDDIHESSDPLYSLKLQSGECYECDLIEQCHWSDRGKEIGVIVDTRFATNIAITRDNITICSLFKHFDEYGQYNLSVSAKDAGARRCRLEQIQSSSNSYLAILYVFLAYVVLFALYHAAVLCRRKYRTSIAERNTVIISDVPNQDEATEQPKKQRLLSLDIFRGIAIVIMVFVDFGGGGYWFFEHATWNGLTVADLAFPWFVFILGVSTFLSINGSVRKQTPLTTIWFNIVQRSVKLFILGIILNSSSSNDLRVLRIFGVLQRLGISYLAVASLVCLHFRRRRFQTVLDESIFADLKRIWFEWLVIIVMVVIYACIIFLVPFADCPSGYFGPGGFENGGKYFNCTGGITKYIDEQILTEKHMYNWPTCREIYNSGSFDPEGVFGTLPSIFNAFLGVQVGAILSTYTSHKSRATRWLIWSIVWGLIAGILCKFSRNEGWIPINKNLWSLSFVLSTAALGLFLLTILYVIADWRRWWNGAPLYQAGMNSIVMYIGHRVLGSYLPFSWAPLASPPSHAELLTMNVWATSLFVLIAVCMERKNVFIVI